MPDAAKATAPPPFPSLTAHAAVLVVATQPEIEITFASRPLRGSGNCASGHAPETFDALPCLHRRKQFGTPDCPPPSAAHFAIFALVGSENPGWPEDAAGWCHVPRFASSSLHVTNITLPALHAILLSKSSLCATTLALI